MTDHKEVSVEELAEVVNEIVAQEYSKMEFGMKYTLGLTISHTILDKYEVKERS